MRQPSWSGWASIRSNLPRGAGVPLLVAVAIMASLGWVLLARGMFPADGTVTFPSAPYWSERGVVINKLLPGVPGCVSVIASWRSTAALWKIWFAAALSATTRWET